MLDQVKNDFPDLRAILDSPLLQNRFRHRAKFAQGEQAETLQKLVSLHVGRGRLLPLAELPQGLIQRATNKIVCGGRKPRIGLENLLNSFGQRKVTHIKIMIELRWFVYGLRPVTPNAVKKKSESRQQNHFSLTTTQGPTHHGQMQFTILPGTIISF